MDKVILDDVSPEMAEKAARQITGGRIAWGGGSTYDLTNPNPEVITIEDVAYALAYTARWRGQTRHLGCRAFYGVGQHVVFGAQEMLLAGHGYDDALSFLFHEADEVVLPDMPGPAKHLISGFRELAAAQGEALLDRFGVTISDHDLIKRWDMRMMVTEKRDLMPGHSGDRFATSGDDVINEVDFPPFKRRITPYDHPDEAARQFLKLLEVLDWRRLCRG